MKKSLLLCLSVLLFSLTPEEDLLVLLSQKLQDFNTTNPASIVHLVFNQSKYAPGDTAFFSAYLVTQDFLPVKGRRIFTLELVNQKGQQEQVTNFTVTNGNGYNQIVLPRSTAEGKYQLTVRSQLSDQSDYV